MESKSAKECVITHLPNELVLKMEDAEITDLDWLLGAQQISFPMNEMREKEATNRRKM